MSIDLVLAIVLLAIFAAGLRLFTPRAAGAAAWQSVRATSALLRSRAATELDKERAARRVAGQLALLALRFIGALAVAAAVPVALLFGFDALGWSSLDGLLAALATPTAIVCGTLVALLALLAR